MNSEEALQELKAGNERFIAGTPIFPNQSPERRAGLTGGQKPFAVILGCSDSRVPPEIIFDQGIGDLFVIRVAGNVVPDAVLGSMEYAVDHLRVPFILVLGHQGCGAVQATIKGGTLPGRIGSLVEAIQPAVEEARRQSGDLLENAVRSNVKRIVRDLKSRGPILAERVSKGELQIRGGYYRLDSGRAEIFTF